MSEDCAQAKAMGPIKDPYLNRRVYVVDCPWHGVSGRYDSKSEAEAAADRHRQMRTGHKGKGHEAEDHVHIGPGTTFSADHAPHQFAMGSMHDVDDAVDHLEFAHGVQVGAYSYGDGAKDRVVRQHDMLHGQDNQLPLPPGGSPQNVGDLKRMVNDAGHHHDFHDEWMNKPVIDIGHHLVDDHGVKGLLDSRRELPDNNRSPFWEHFVHHGEPHDDQLIERMRRNGKGWPPPELVQARHELAGRRDVLVRGRPGEPAQPAPQPGAGSYSEPGHNHEGQDWSAMANPLASQRQRMMDHLRNGHPEIQREQGELPTGLHLENVGKYHLQLHDLWGHAPSDVADAAAGRVAPPQLRPDQHLHRPDHENEHADHVHDEMHWHHDWAEDLSGHTGADQALHLHDDHGIDPMDSQGNSLDNYDMYFRHVRAHGDQPEALAAAGYHVFPGLLERHNWPMGGQPSRPSPVEHAADHNHDEADWEHQWAESPAAHSINHQHEHLNDVHQLDTEGLGNTDVFALHAAAHGFPEEANVRGEIKGADRDNAIERLRAQGQPSRIPLVDFIPEGAKRVEGMGGPHNHRDGWPSGPYSHLYEGHGWDFGDVAGGLRQEDVRAFHQRLHNMAGQPEAQPSGAGVPHDWEALRRWKPGVLRDHVRDNHGVEPPEHDQQVYEHHWVQHKMNGGRRMDPGLLEGDNLREQHAHLENGPYVDWGKWYQPQVADGVAQNHLRNVHGIKGFENDPRDALIRHWKEHGFPDEGRPPESTVGGPEELEHHRHRFAGVHPLWNGGPLRQHIEALHPEHAANPDETLAQAHEISHRVKFFEDIAHHLNTFGHRAEAFARTTEVWPGQHGGKRHLVEISPVNNKSVEVWSGNRSSGDELQHNWWDDSLDIAKTIHEHIAPSTPAASPSGSPGHEADHDWYQQWNNEPIQDIEDHIVAVHKTKPWTGRGPEAYFHHWALHGRPLSGFQSDLPKHERDFEEWQKQRGSFHGPAQRQNEPDEPSASSLGHSHNGREEPRLEQIEGDGASGIITEDAIEYLKHHLQEKHPDKWREMGSNPHPNQQYGEFWHFNDAHKAEHREGRVGHVDDEHPEGSHLHVGPGGILTTHEPAGPAELIKPFLKDRAHSHEMQAPPNDFRVQDFPNVFRAQMHLMEGHGIGHPSAFMEGVGDQSPNELHQVLHEIPQRETYDQGFGNIGHDREREQALRTHLVEKHNLDINGASRQLLAPIHQRQHYMEGFSFGAPTRRGGDTTCPNCHHGNVSEMSIGDRNGFVGSKEPEKRVNSYDDRQCPRCQSLIKPNNGELVRIGPYQRRPGTASPDQRPKGTSGRHMHQWVEDVSRGLMEHGIVTHQSWMSGGDPETYARTNIFKTYGTSEERTRHGGGIGVEWGISDGNLVGNQHPQHVQGEGERPGGVFDTGRKWHHMSPQEAVGSIMARVHPKAREMNLYPPGNPREHTQASVDDQWFDGTSASVVRRIASLRAEAELAEPEQRVEMLDEADTLEPVAEAYRESEAREQVQVEAALDYSDLISSGMVDIDRRIEEMIPGSDWLSREARAVVAESAMIDWDAFPNTARSWVERELRRSPGMIENEVMTRMAAVDYAGTKTTSLLDPVHRQRVIQEFVENVERLRRDAAVLESEDIVLLW